MKSVLLRAAFSPAIYEVVDVAVGLYDADVRLLAQAPTLPLKLGTLDACINNAVAAVGGREVLEEGDIVIYNVPYGTGAHPQDVAIILPVFVDGRLIGYAPCKAHMVDLAGKDPYSTDTVDVHQEATILPGLKLYRKGELNHDLMDVLLANTRAPKVVRGDLSAMVGSARAGARALEAMIQKYGYPKFQEAVEQIFEYSERKMREFIAGIPDGKYQTGCCIDDNGRDDADIRFDLHVEVAGDEISVDLTDAPPQQPGPVNSLRPNTISALRVALASLAGVAEEADEGQFRPLTVKTTPGSLFECTYPAPSFVYWAASLQLIDGFHRALAPELPENVAAESGSDILVFVWWSHNRLPYQRRAFDSGEPWIDGGSTPVGQGGHATGDGTNALMHLIESNLRIGPAERCEAHYPWLIERRALAVDSCGAGRHRGGCGIDFRIRMLDDCFVTSVVERTKVPPRGLYGGADGQPNSVTIRHADGRTTTHGKQTRVLVEKDSVFEVRSGGGAGYGPPSAREVSTIEEDLRDGYVTPEYVRRWYPQYNGPFYDERPV